MMGAVRNIVITAGVWLGILCSLCNGSCVAEAIKSTLSDETCNQATSSEANLASMRITGCILGRLKSVPRCLKSGSESCLQSLSPEIYSSYRGVRAKWSLFCEATLQASALARLRKFVEDDRITLEQIIQQVKEVENNAVEGVENKLRIEETFGGNMREAVDGVVGEARKVRDVIEMELDKVNNAYAEIRDMRTPKIKKGGVLSSGYGSLAGILVGAGRLFSGVVGVILFASAAVSEYLEKWVWILRLSLLAYCGWLVIVMPEDRLGLNRLNRKSKHDSKHDSNEDSDPDWDPALHSSLDEDSDDESDITSDDSDENSDHLHNRCDCCFDDALYAR